MFAINWDVNNDPAWNNHSPQQVAQDFQGFRCVTRQNIEARVAQCKAAGLTYMGVYTSESNGYVSPQCDWVQVHNEPGDNMSPETFVHEYTTVRSHYDSVHGTGHHKWMFPGLHFGPTHSIDWLHRVFGLLHGGFTPDAIALHLYTMTPTTARDYCDEVWNQFQIPVACTEWWRPAVQGHHPFQCMLGGNGLDGQGARCGIWNSYFCLSDHMTAHTEGSHMGLYDLNGNPKAEYYSLLSAPGDCRQ